MKKKFLVILFILLFLSPYISAQNQLLPVDDLIREYAPFLYKRYELEKGRAEKRRKSSYYQSILSSKYFAAEMTFYRFRKKITSRLLKLKKLFIAQDMRIFRKKILLQQPVSMIGNTAYYAYYVVVAAGIAAGRYSLGDFALFTGAFSSVQGSMGQIMGAFSQIYEHNLFVKNYYDFLSYPEESAGSQFAVPPVLTGRKEKIVFDSVRFTYPGTNKEVLKGISLAIREGEKAALVGENGSGKTTLIKLLLGFYDAYEGGIYLDGKELRTWDKEELYLQYGAVFQDFQPYYLSAAENVWIAAGDRVMDDEAAAEALVRSGADFAFGLPNGLRTPPAE